jgi:cation diffusion facilitator family transporter
MISEKKRVALISVIAAVFLTLFKIVIGLKTNSLGILSEALHSGLDLVAALITLFAVRISDKPADKDHHFGHGKVENISALFETLLLLVTCVWIITEAIERLSTGRTEITVTFWSYLVVITSIVIDFSRSRVLYKTARKYNSQALEADALHFSTDIWSSSVVLFGLILASRGLFFADSIAALIVAAIVIYVSIRLGKKAIDVLLDRSPDQIFEKIETALRSIGEITHFHDLKVRQSGSDTFVELNIHVDPGLTIEQAHEITHRVEHEIKTIIDRCEIHIHTEPETHAISK